MRTKAFVVGIIFLLITTFSFSQNNKSDNWPQWRGPLGTGAAVNGNPPIEFSETKNLKWKTDIPGLGHATPIVWEDKIIVLTAVSTDQKGSIESEEEGGGWMNPTSTEYIHDFKVLCIDRNTGKIN